MSTFAQIKAKVATRIIDLPTAVSDEVPNLVNAAMREIQNRHNFKVMETAGSLLSTVVGVRALATVPANFKELHGEPYMTPNVGRPRFLSVAANRQMALNSFANNVDGSPRFLLFSEPSDTGARNIEVWPLPDGHSDYVGGEYRITVPYWRFLPALSADSDTNWFTVNAENWLIFKAAAEGFALDWDTGHETEWLQKAEREFGLAANVDKRQQTSGVTTLVPHRGARAVRPTR